MKKRKDGLYQKQVYIGTIEGKKKYKAVYGKTQKEVEQKANEIKAQLGKGIDLGADDSFAFWCDAFVRAKRNETGDSQADLYKARLDYFLCYNFNLDIFDFQRTHQIADKKIGSVKLWELQRVIDAIAAENPYTHKPTSKRTLNAIRHSAIDVYAFAIRNRITEFNTAEGLTIAKAAPQEERRALTREEQQRVIEFEHRAQLPAMLMMLCGLRRGEVTALTWADVDFESAEITVNKAWDFKAQKLKQPKTKAGNRTVPIPNNLLDFLKNEPRISVFVVPSRTGQRMTNGNWTRLIKTYLSDMKKEYEKGEISPVKIQPFTWHCLRHTYATILYDAGVDVLTAQRLLGHSDPSVTMNIYTHLSNEKQKADIEKLNQFLNEKNGVSKVQVKNAENR